MRDFLFLLREAYRGFNEDRAQRLAASLAYFALFSAAPMALVAVAIAGSLYGRDAAAGALARQLGRFFSPQVSAAVQELVLGASRRSASSAAYGLGAITLIAAAMGFFDQLKDALDTIWGVRRKGSGGFLKMIKDYLVSAVMVALAGALLVASLVASALLHALDGRLGFAPAEWAAHLLEGALSVAIFTLVFGTLFRALPDVKIAWRHVGLGALLTALLFQAGKWAVGWYLGKSGIASAYGAAGSLLVLLLWTYYCAQIFLFGAEFTKVYSIAHGLRIGPPRVRP